jgi:hypothetical protein
MYFTKTIIISYKAFQNNRGVTNIFKVTLKNLKIKGL